MKGSQSPAETEQCPAPTHKIREGSENLLGPTIPHDSFLEYSPPALVKPTGMRGEQKF